MREKIVYRHPKGRFEVVERSGKDIFGNLYRIREARLTPEKDERGLLTNAALPVPVLRDRPAEPQRDKPKTTRGGWRKKLTDEEKTWIRRLFENGMSMKQIAREISRSDTVVRDYLTDEAKLRTPRGWRAWTDDKSRSLCAIKKMTFDLLIRLLSSFLCSIIFIFSSCIPLRCV